MKDLVSQDQNFVRVMPDLPSIKWNIADSMTWMNLQNTMLYRVWKGIYQVCIDKKFQKHTSLNKAACVTFALSMDLEFSYLLSACAQKISNLHCIILEVSWLKRLFSQLTFFPENTNFYLIWILSLHIFDKNCKHFLSMIGCLNFIILIANGSYIWD